MTDLFKQILNGPIMEQVYQYTLCKIDLYTIRKTAIFYTQWGHVLAIFQAAKKQAFILAKKKR